MNMPIIELTEIGEMVKNEIEKTNQIRQNVKIEKYVIMPDHIHLIIEIFDNLKNYSNNIVINKKGTVPRAPTVEKFGKPTCKTVCTIVRYLKSGVTRMYNKKYKTNIQIWQRNYYEKIIRNENEYFRIYEYIRNNPMRYLKKCKLNHNLHS